MKPVIEKFLRYVKIDTQSQESDCVPSTDKQRDLARLLVKELHEMGASDVRFDEEHCYVYATIPSNLPEGKKAPVIGFIARRQRRRGKAPHCGISGRRHRFKRGKADRPFRAG